MIAWNKVRHFVSSEFNDPDFPGSGDCINGILLFQLDKLREETGWPIITHAKVGGCVDVLGNHGHAKNSYHLKSQGCKAVDFHFDTNASSRFQFFMVTKLGFGGVGIYYHWWWNGKLLPAGFHVDVRDKNKCQLWSCSEKGKYKYFLK